MKKKTFFLNEKVQRPKHFIRVIAHVNIGLQVAFPLAISFSPVMVARAETEGKKYSIINNSAKADIYVLRPGDTLKLIAEKYQISVAELKTFNQYRAFAHGFESVSVGDEIDVPAQSQNIAIDAGSSDSAELAQRAQQAGNFLQNNLSADSAKDLARGQALGAANSKANQEVASWLNGKGKARVKLDADRDFSLKKSELDVLYPLWENNAHQIFTQGSVHHTDSRNQSNLGLGYRYFEGSYMLGANTFFDHDWSRSHSRLGLGAEYQRDFLKVAANAYMRLTNWKTSPDFDNYEERPANGWDIRTEGYLPDYPGIGGKLVYEKYYGDRVGLFGKDNQQKNPVAVTAGVNYSPFPLMKFNIDHRMGKSNQNDTRFGIDLNYVLGAPLSQQLDSSMLAASRSLAANRYDFVDRNNNIVLEYRKKDTISLRLASQISGYSGESKSLGVSVNSTNGVERIEWIAPELLSQGGQIVQVSEQQFNVIIPEYQYGSDANNSYVVSGVAYDKSGNASPKAESLVVVASAAVSTVNSTLTPMELQLPNDGHSTAELTLVLRDANNHPVSGVAGDIKAAISQLGRTQSDIKFSGFFEDKAQLGTYKATVTAGKTVGEYKLTPEIQNIKIAPATLYVGRAPMISDLTVSGKLALGEQLSGHYQFDSNNGNTQDASLYQWGNKGQTAELNGAETIVTSGSVPSYTLIASDVGQVKELSVQARNGLETLGNTLTVTTAPGDSGNNTEGGNNGSITDEATAPKISDLNIEGQLAVGQALSGRYTFDAQTGNPTDASLAQWGEKGSTAATVATQGLATKNGTLPTYTILETDAGKVLEVSVLAKNGAGVTGNTDTVTTAPGDSGNNTEGGNNGSITDEATAPKISDLNIEGQLAVGQALSGRYTFDAQTGNPTDASLAQWGEKGSTAATVATQGLATKNGTLPSYTIKSSDAGKVLEVSVLAKNGAGVTGNTDTVTTAPGDSGNNTEGGNNGSITDEATAPKISDLNIEGQLAVGQALNGRYTFDAQTGNPTDASLAQWGEKGSTAATVATQGLATKNGTLPSYTIKSSDAGKVLEVSVLAKNGAGVTGNTDTVTTAPGDSGNNTEGGNNGSITDEATAPKISDLNIEGQLAVGQALSGRYTFDAQTGNPTDASLAQWGEKGSTAATVATQGLATKNGTLPTYTILETDAGKVLEVSVLAKNGAGVTGNTDTVTTAPGDSGNNTEGGNNGSITDEATAPKISDLNIEGQLAVGQALSGRYTFDAQTGNPTDASLAQWGEKGSTAATVATQGLATKNGTLPSYTIKSSDAGKVLEVSVLAKNGAGVTGNTDTVTTAPGDSGNNTEGGNNGSITDEATAPKISDLNIEGQLAVGQALSGRYTFDAQTGNPTDASLAQWGEKGSTAATVATQGLATKNGTLPTYTILETDAGKVLEVSVLAKNGAGVTGNTDTVTTAPGDSGNNTEGGNNGSITDEATAPKISDLNIEGQLAVGQALNGRYTFDAQTGNPTDASLAQWGEKGSTAATVATQGLATKNGTLPTYTILETDAGKVLEVSVLAKNGAGVTGNTDTVTTAPGDSGNNTEGGNNGSITDEATAPKISDLNIEGQLAVGQALNGRYTFDAQTGNPTDASLAQWGEKGSTAATVATQGLATKNGTLPTYTILETDAGKVLEVSVLAKNGAGVTGNTDTVTTAPGDSGNNTEGGNNGSITDEATAPKISDLNIEGQLAVGQALSGRYTFDAQTGNPTDASLAQWGEKGSTAATVATQGLATKNGTLPSYTIKSSDAGKVLEVSVLAKNGAGVTGNTDTVTTAPGDSGNNTEGGNNGSITDEATAPKISDLNIEGQLAVGQALSGRYTFDAQTGNPTDASLAQWGEKGSTAATVATQGLATKNGTLPSYTIKSSDAGKVLEVSVLAKNGAGVTGNTDTVTTAPGDSGNNTEGGNNGSITDEATAPKISDLNIEGQLAVGQALSGRYTFDAQTGNPTDASLAQWGEKGSTAATVATQGLATKNGTLPTYTILETDAGKVLEVSVLAKNGAGVTGNTDTVTTAPGDSGNNTEGGNNGSITDEATAPKISDLNIEGQLAVGQALNGRYTFDAQTGNPTDASLAQWGEKGSTAATVATQGLATKNGTLPSYTIKSSDAGKVLEVSVLAKNGAGVTGNTDTVTTAPGDSGNNTEGGNNGSITDEATAPKISDLNIEGQLAVGQALSGRYTFDAQTGNPTDASLAQWGEKGSTAATVATQGLATKNGTLPTYTILETDAGKVLEVSVLAKNGAGVTGNTDTVTTAPGDSGNNTEGGNNGSITDEATAPKISDLNIEGQLAVGQALNGRYTFDAQTGNPTDASLAQWGEKGSTAATVATQGLATKNGTLPTYTILETDAGKVLEVSVLAKNGAGVTGNTDTVTTAPGDSGNNTEGGNNGSITDEATAPKISDLNIEGQLAVGQALNGRYTFDAQTGNPTDASLAQWGEKGSTAATVATQGLATKNGTLPSYTIKSSDAGKVLEVSVLAKNGAGVTGNTDTVTTAPGDSGNNTEGGNNGSITDEATAPKISDLNIEGQLAVGQALSGRYTFDAQTGNPTDASLAQWGEKGSTAATVATQGLATKNGTLPSYTIKSSDAGKVLEVSVLAKNGAGVTGNTDTVTTAPGDSGNNTEGGNNGSITDEATAPKISDLNIEGQLAVGQALNGRYTFDAQTGNPTDASLAQWGEKGSTAATVATQGLATKNGTLPTYTIKSTDMGKVLEVSVLAKNGAGVTGNTDTVTTAPGDSGNNTEGGNNGSIALEEPPASVNTQVNKYTFIQTSAEGTFPTTGFIGATFTIVPKDGKKATDYIWTADANWVSVEGGVVTFIAKGSGSKVTITGTPKKNGNIIKYSFTLKGWFINGSSLMDWSSADRYCSSQQGYSLPKVSEVSDFSRTGERGIGALWVEWGRPSNYPGAGFSSGSIWSLEPSTSGVYYTADLDSGGWGTSPISNRLYVTCRQSL